MFFQLGWKLKCKDGDYIIKLGLFFGLPIKKKKKAVAMQTCLISLSHFIKYLHCYKQIWWMNTGIGECMGAASWVQTLPLISAAPSGNTWFWSISGEISHFKGFFYLFESMAFEPEMRLAFIFIETLTHRIITKKHLQIKTRQDIQEKIRKQSSPNEWGFFVHFHCLFLFLNST